MANHASAEKRNRQRIVKTARNRATKASVRTDVKKVRAAVTAGKKDEAAKALVVAASHLDKAAKKGAIHKKAASRTQARLAKALHKLSQALSPPWCPTGSDRKVRGPLAFNVSEIV